jgi:hypothetical protein
MIWLLIAFVVAATQDPPPTQDRPPAVAKRSEPRCKGCATSKKRAPRSTAAHNAFRKSHPCPATGNTAGACPGYIVDHVVPFACGGRDDASNMQWQTSADTKAEGPSRTRRLWPVNRRSSELPCVDPHFAALGLEA